MQSIDSPCKKICLLHPQFQLCTGCGRTLEEIGQWLTLSPAQRTSVMKAALQRLDAMHDNDVRTSPPAAGNN